MFRNVYYAIEFNRAKKVLATFVILLFTFAHSAAGQSNAAADKAEQRRKELQSMTQAFPAPEYVGRNPTSDREYWNQVAPLRQHLMDLEKEFATEIATDTQPYRNLKGTIAYTRDRLNGFETALRSFTAMEQFEQEAQHARKMIRLAEENQAPAYFRPDSDIFIRFRSIEQRLITLEQLEGTSPATAKAKKLAADLSKEIQEAQKNLKQKIIASNEIPTDGYRGTDRDALIRVIEKTWLDSNPKLKPIRVGLIGSEWTRTKKWEIQNRSLYEVDRSRIQGYVLIPHDGTTVLKRNIQLQQDHTNNQRLSAWLIDNSPDSAQPQDLILKSKLK